MQRVRGEGQTYRLITDIHTIKATGDETNGAFAVTEITARPEFGPPPHTHTREDESFYVVEGDLECSLDNGTPFVVRAGTFVYLPKGVLHTHKAVGTGPARVIAMYVPSGVERFIAEAGQPTSETDPPAAIPDMSDLQRIVAIAATYGITVPAPPAGTA
jgi:quercetin dioxygenase-like cupin family protein